MQDEVSAVDREKKLSDKMFLFYRVDIQVISVNLRHS